MFNLFNKKIPSYILFWMYKRKNKLPIEYQEVEYIESTGTQYIDTVINADIKLDVDIDMQYTNVSAGNNYTNFGTIYQSGNNYMRYHINKTNSGYLAGFILQEATTRLNLYDTDKHNYYIKASDRKIIIDEVEYKLSNNDYEDTNLNFWLFGRNSNVNNLIFYNSSKLYGCKMYYNNVLVRNFIPCYRKLDNEIGLYDLIDNKFYTNKGTGNFIKGNNK